MILSSNSVLEAWNNWVLSDKLCEGGQGIISGIPDKYSRTEICM